MQLQDIPIELLHADPDNERADVSEGLDDLVASIKAKGVLEPVRVFPYQSEGGHIFYTISSGHRRVAAAKKAGLRTVPAVIVEKPRDDTERAVERLVTNLQRKDLGPLERARGLKAVLEADPELTQARLGEMLGLSQPTIANAVRILELPEAVQKIVEKGGLTAGHCQALLQVKSPKYEWNGQPVGTVEDAVVALATQFVEHVLPVQGAENLVKNHEHNGEYHRKHAEDLKRWDEQKAEEARKRAEDLAKQGKTEADVERERRERESAESKARMQRQHVAWSSLKDSTRIDPKDGPSLAHLKLAALELNRVAYSRDMWGLEKEAETEKHILNCTEKSAVIGWIARLAQASCLNVNYGDNFLSTYSDKLKWADKTWHINEHIQDALERAGLAKGEQKKEVA